MIQNRSFYYRKLYVLFELVKVMKNREVVFMDRVDNYKCVRGIYVKTVDYLKGTFFDVFHFLEKDYNIYISCAKYDGIPPFTFNLSKRSGETSVFFEREALNLITHYDLLIDFDCPKDANRGDYLKEVEVFYNLLNENKICFYMIFSGNNYQIVIPSDVYGFERKIEKINGSIFIKPYVLIREIKERFNLKYLDLKGIGVFNKIMKCPYSLVQDRVCLPIIFDGMDNIYNSDYVLKKYIIKNRGLIYHNNKGVVLNQKAFRTFANKFKIEKYLKREK